MGRKPKMPPEQMRALILDAARTIYFKEGPSELSARRLSERIGFSPTVIYLHFSGMPEILSTLREEGFRLLGHLLRTVSEGTDPLERLVRRVLGLYEFLVNNPGYHRLMFFPIEDYEVTETARTVFLELIDGVDRDVRSFGGYDEGRVLINLVLGSAARELVASELEGVKEGSQLPVIRKQLERTLESLLGESGRSE
jgi:AcrR family transcriptional regulator